MFRVFLVIFPLARCLFPDYEYDFADDLPVQDARILRDEKNVERDILPDRFFGRGNDTEKDWTWLEEALKDIAYYLRAHKFNEYDRRYEKEEDANRKYFSFFPKPPLRTLHWEVHYHCEPSFLKCVTYLGKKIRETDFTRSDDTSLVINEQKWDDTQHAFQIKSVEDECRKNKAKEEKTLSAFQGPIERFQWRTTASYYMCWYTMNEVPDLSHLHENCDNHANCLDVNYGANNKDFRAKDNVPFSCATYSFCPDPCCSIKHATSQRSCWTPEDNPCFNTLIKTKICQFEKRRNKSFNDLILNHFNVTCECPESGYNYNSAYGLCLDTDECATLRHTCKNSSGEACLNTRGSYRCVCKWGYTWKEDKCVENLAIAKIKMIQIVTKEEAVLAEKKKEKSVIRRFFKKHFSKSNGGKISSKFSRYFTTWICNLFNFLIQF